jgi:hypothetical protein
MPDFSELFEKANWQPINFKDNVVIQLDKFPVRNEEVLIATIEKTNSDWRQGFCIDIAGSCEIDGQIFKQGKGVRMLFWEDTAPKQIKLKIFTKKEFVWIENIWEQINYYSLGASSGKSITKESKSVESRHHGAAMIVEEIKNGRRYRCNDGHPDENFDDIVFTVQRISK